ncbi:alpha/beta-hydrolase [Xylariaceae sp. AK1471]|nr:alpha/beta-hydrolase [Xylariaceae sp. AK1471]
MATDYPDPFIVPPRSLPHKHTFIILHGRGSSGEAFGSVLLEFPIVPPGVLAASSSPTLASLYPNARFVFPTAARRRATVYKRAYTHQWFDNWKLEPPATDREELQIPGLQETTSYLHRLVREEIALVPGGAANAILGGLSQGCAASLIALLLWEGDGLAAAFGMCGWLPYAVRMGEEMQEDKPSQGHRFGEDVQTEEDGGDSSIQEHELTEREGIGHGKVPEKGYMFEEGTRPDLDSELTLGSTPDEDPEYDGNSEESIEDSESDVVSDSDDEELALDDDALSFSPAQEDDFNPFESDTVPDHTSDPTERAIAWLREELQVPNTSTADSSLRFHNIPLFLGHGVLDDRVSINLGRAASTRLARLGVNVSWNEYEGLGHWYSGPMLWDLVGFLREKTGWNLEDDNGTH